ncbi:MAG TPA: N-acetylmuramoyl-L-alanine amidase [Acidiferrobacterales bacterium]|nr:N-acetylmuramoyl-L-alanine amidase [Acidiferrobacterales bacterium]
MKTIGVFLLLFFGLISMCGQADVVTVHNLRVWQAPDHTRLVFDLSGPLEHRLFTLKDPDRIVVDMENASFQGAVPALDASDPRLAGVRAGARGESDVRIVLDLKTETRPRTFILKPYEQYGHRLVVDLYDAKLAAEEEKPVLPLPKPVNQKLVIAIDAGHGGEDPGAIGRKRTREKDVVLAIARELRKLINATPGMRAFLVRDGDYYISLRGRIEEARKHDPDAFISIHADAMPGKTRRVRGASVYALSETGANTEAALLAKQENAADLIGGVSLNEKDDVLTKVLVEMWQTGTISSSVELGDDILTELRRIGPVHIGDVSQANFVVLRSHRMPSILIETAFISNPDEEKKLRDKNFQRRIAKGIFNGLQRAAPRLLARRGLPTTVSNHAADKPHEL